VVGQRNVGRSRSLVVETADTADLFSVPGASVARWTTQCETRRVLIVRGTTKLRNRVGGTVATTQDASTTFLGDWFATALLWTQQVALLVNRRTFVPVFVPLAPARTLLDRVPGAIAEALRRHGADDAFIADELAAMSEVRIAPTNHRSTLGVLNQYAFHGEWRTRAGTIDLDELGMQLSEMPLGPLRSSTYTADRELAALLGIAPTVGGRQRSAHPAATEPLQVKVTLRNVSPPVWRRLVLPAGTTLHELHEYIQAAFGWWNYHLYEFEISRKRYGIPDPDDDFGPPPADARRTTLSTVAGVGTSFLYTYDFGDGWDHTVEIEQLHAQVTGAAAPACIDGRRACPPEDCGGPWGYREFLEIIGSPDHPEHAERVEWAGDWGGARLDPDAFDPAEFDQNLRTVRGLGMD